MARAQLSGSLVLALLAACSSRPAAAPPDDPAAARASPIPGALDDSLVCRTAACWQDLARQAAQFGITDRAAGLLGRAFEHEPAVAAFDAWLDALLAGGELRRAHRALDLARRLAHERKDDALLTAIDTRAAALPPPGPDRPIAPGPLSAPLRAALEPEAAGRLDAAAFLSALDDSREPFHIAHGAELLDRRGDLVAAARVRARARALLYEAGAALRPVPVDTGLLAQVAWHDGQLVLLLNVGAIEPASGERDKSSALELWDIAPGPAPARRLRFPRRVLAIAFSDDGRTLVRAESGAIVFQDMSSESEIARIPLAARPDLLAAGGSGDALRVLVAAGGATTLWNTRGELLATYTLAGTTPTLVRGRTGAGSHHEDVLQDSPSWPIALALGGGADLIAIGGSDAKIRLFDRKRDAEELLVHEWTSTERRYRDADPDLNAPRALRFTRGGDGLVAAYPHGEVIEWDARRGVPLRRMDGPCDTREAEVYVNRYNDSGDPRYSASDDERRACGKAAAAALSPDGTTVANSGGERVLRIRSVVAGAPIATPIADEIFGKLLAFRDADTLAAVDIRGEVLIWRRGQAVLERIRPRDPLDLLDPTLSAGGRFLRFEPDSGPRIVWDLHERRRLDLAGPGETLVELAGDGRFAAVYTGDALELRAGGRAILRVPGKLAAAQVQFTRDHALLDLDHGRTHTLHLASLRDGRLRPLDFVGRYDRALLAEGGRRLATVAPGDQLKVWRVERGRLARTLDFFVQHLAFAPGGDRLAWIPRPWSQPGFTVKHLTLGRPRTRTLDLPGFPVDLAFASDGAELLILTEAGELHRWRPDTGQHTHVKDLALRSRRRVRAHTGGKVLILESYDSVHLRADDPDLTSLATLFPLPGGGWLALGSAGAIDGSDDAIANLLTRVDGPDGPQVLDGRVVWEAAHLPGVLERALAGEALAPPLALSP